MSMSNRRGGCMLCYRFEWTLTANGDMVGLSQEILTEAVIVGCAAADKAINKGSRQALLRVGVKTMLMKPVYLST